MISITLKDGTPIDIHDSALSKFFDCELGIQPHPSRDDIQHGRLTLYFAVPGQSAPSARPLDTADGAMVVMRDGSGRVSFR